MRFWKWLKFPADFIKGRAASEYLLRIINIEWSQSYGSPCIDQWSGGKDQVRD